MSYTTTEDISGLTGAILVAITSSLQSGGRAEVDWTEILEENVKFPIGTSFELVEELTFSVNIDDESLIDIDLRYQSPRRYLGTWQLSGALISSIYPIEGQEGFIWYPDTTIVRRNRYCVVPIPTPKYKDSEGTVDNCNFRLAGAQLSFAGSGVIALETGSEANQFKFTNSRRNYVPDGKATLEIDQVGLYLNSGVSGRSVSYDARIDGVAYVSSINPVQVVCNDRGNRCREAFYRYLAGLSPVPAPIFAVALTLPEAVEIANAQILGGATSSIPVLVQFPCPDGGTFPYYEIRGDDILG